MMDGVKQSLLKEVLDDEDIALHWCMLAMEIEEDESAVLLKMLVDLFITI